MQRNEIEKCVAGIVKELYPQDEGGELPEDLPVLGPQGVLDSVLGLQLLLKIEKRFGIVVQDEEIEGDNLSSITRISRFIESKLTQV